MPGSNGQPDNLATVVTDVSERVTLLVREEIELAKAEMTEKASVCTACDLSEKRTNVVFGEGNPNSPLVIVGEGPERPARSAYRRCRDLDAYP